MQCECYQINNWDQQRVNLCSRQNYTLIYSEACSRIIPTQLKIVGYSMTTGDTVKNHSRKPKEVSEDQLSYGIDSYNRNKSVNIV